MRVEFGVGEGACWLGWACGVLMYSGRELAWSGLPAATSLVLASWANPGPGEVERDGKGRDEVGCKG